MPRNAISVANGKGGVGKTSIVANVGGIVAARGWDVLLVDLDPQGNLGADLGFTTSQSNDAGADLYDAVVHGAPLRPIIGVRPRLDVITGGDATDDLDDWLRDRRKRYGLGSLGVVAATLEPLMATRDLVLIDCPPTAGALVEAALIASGELLIPTRGDAASLQGLARTARRFLAVRKGPNPDLALLGVALFDFGAQDRRLVAKARGQLEDALGGVAPVFRTYIRNARKAPDDMREQGLLAHEYQRSAQQAPRWYDDPDAERYSSSATGLAADYQELTEEILATRRDRLARGDRGEGPTPNRRG